MYMYNLVRYDSNSIHFYDYQNLEFTSHSQQFQDAPCWIEPNQSYWI